VGSNEIQYLQGIDFTKSLKALMQKGGQYQKAGNRIKQAWATAHMGGHSYEEVFAGLTTTNHGENRIENCVKFDLSGFSRLVTAYSNNICIFLYAGDHDAVHGWLDKNKGMNFVAKKQGESLRVEPVFVSDRKPGKHGLIHSETDWMTNGPVIDLLPERYRSKLLKKLDNHVVEQIRSIESDSDEDAVEAVIEQIADPELSYVVLDVLLALRSSDINKAKTRIDLLVQEATPVGELSKPETDKIISSDTTVRLQDLPADLFEHFVKTADFKAWMLFLHPDQREFVSRDFVGPTRLSGVSGSGKTCVVIHRALRLARQSPEKRVLVLTLNEALASLIGELVDAAAGATRPTNVEIKSVFDLCREKLIEFNPDKRDYFGKSIAKRNQFAATEHIDDIWVEFYHCHNNYHDADVMFEVARTLLTRKVFPQDYLRQELDYLRSAFSPNERRAYLEMEREGRVVPLLPKYREMVIRGLEGWERKMNAVGAIDDIGIVTALYEHLDKLTAEYDHVLVDEVQDLGTLELRVIRRITREGKNDIFLCGDAAQTVHTKHADMKSAEIDLPPARCIKLNQNYRNSRQILTAAHAVLTESFASIPQGTTNLEILPPEFANFSSAKPLLIEAGSMEDELAMALSYAEATIADSSNKKACIALCGYSQSAVEALAANLELPALCGRTNISDHTIFLSDLEQTKGFEFDLMVVLNCCDGVIPHPDLPEHESFRELCKLYVALTRAKTELFVSYHGEPSRFVAVAEEHFVKTRWSEHSSAPKSLAGIIWPAPALRAVGDRSAWEVTGKAFLQLREAVGLSQQTQEEILSHVTGSILREGTGARKQLQWKEFLVFYEDMEAPKVRYQIISDEVWNELRSKLEPIIQDEEEYSDEETTTGAEGTAKHQKPLSKSRTPTLTSTGQSGLSSRSVILHRHEGVLSYTPSDLVAHTLASLQITQQAIKIDNLSVGIPMDYGILGFLIPRRVLAEWLQKKRLRQMRTNPNAMLLTKAGLDECKRLIFAGDTSKQPEGMVNTEDIERHYNLILAGNGPENDNTKFYKKSFELK